MISSFIQERYSSNRHNLFHFPFLVLLSCCFIQFLLPFFQVDIFSSFDSLGVFVMPKLCIILQKGLIEITNRHWKNLIQKLNIVLFQRSLLFNKSQQLFICDFTLNQRINTRLLLSLVIYCYRGFTESKVLLCLLIRLLSLINSLLFNIFFDFNCFNSFSYL